MSQVVSDSSNEYLTNLFSSAYAPTIKVLDSHATTVASEHKRPSEAFESAFAEFITVLKDSDYASGYLENGHSRLAQRYWAYMEVIRG